LAAAYSPLAIVSGATSFTRFAGQRNRLRTRPSWP
jgi:hypothetical protein